MLEEGLEVPRRLSILKIDHTMRCFPFVSSWMSSDVEQPRQRQSPHSASVVSELTVKCCHGKRDNRLCLSIHMSQWKFAHLEAAIECGTDIGADQDIDSGQSRDQP